MPKFYVESGSFRTVLNKNTFMEAVLECMGNIWAIIATDNSDMCISETISINECGFIDSLVGNKLGLDKKYVALRKRNTIILHNLFMKPHYFPGVIVFMPTSKVIEHLNKHFPG